MKRIALTIIVFLLVMFLGWYGGADFTVRSQDNSGFLLLAIICALATYFLPIHNQPETAQNGDSNES